MNLSFDHVHLQSSDPEATIGFFQTMFDGQVEWTIQFDGTDITRMKVLDTHVNIFSRAPKVSDPDPDDAAVHHFALRAGDFDAAIADLRKRGANFVVEPRQAGQSMRLAFISGPDNVRIEIIHGDG